FFQAEDGIRDRNVTGVQTCALPILKARAYAMFGKTNKAVATALTAADMFEDEAELAMGHCCELLAGKFLVEKHKWVEAITLFSRSEERRVGKVCRARRSR